MIKYQVITLHGKRFTESEAFCKYTENIRENYQTTQINFFILFVLRLNIALKSFQLRLFFKSRKKSIKGDYCFFIFTSIKLFSEHVI